MEDYPKTLAEFEASFSTDEGCRRYLFELRWPEGSVCPRCGEREAWTTERELMVCTACGYHASVTTGTIFEKTHKPLTLWFRAIWWLTALKTGASALGLQRVLGLKSYKTAWTWLHNALIIFWDGIVYPCTQDFFGHYPLGNAHEDTLESIWNSPEAVGLRKKLACQDIQDLAACSKCDRPWRKRLLGVPREYLWKFIFKRMP